MDFTFDGGTPRQRQWVNDALDACTYPLVNIAATVKVKWVKAMPGNADTTHPYMVTEIEDDGSYLISIIDWADDYTNPGNQGLTNPPGQIHDFYAECFIHEVGHVWSFAVFDAGDTDPQHNATVAFVTGFFWHGEPGGAASPTDIILLPALAGSHIPAGGRRYGTADDWEGKSGHPVPPWNEEIRESWAEIFKMLYSGTKPVYGNRTNWQISLARAKALSDALGNNPWIERSVAQGPPPFTSLLASLLVDSISMSAFGQVRVSLAAATLPNGLPLDPAFPDASKQAGWSCSAEYVGGGVNFYTDAHGSLVSYAQGINNLSLNTLGGYGNAGWSEAGASYLALQTFNNDTGEVGNHLLSVPLQSGPFWLTLEMNVDRWTAAIFDRDPETAHAPTYEVHVSAPVPDPLTNSTCTLFGVPSPGPQCNYRCDDFNTAPLQTIDVVEEIPGVWDLVVDGGAVPPEFVVLQEDGPSLVLGELRMDFGPPAKNMTNTFDDAFLVPAGTSGGPHYYTPWAFSTVGAGTLVSLPLAVGREVPVGGGAHVRVPPPPGLAGPQPIVEDGNQEDLANPGFDFVPYDHILTPNLSIGPPLRGANTAIAAPAGRVGIKEHAVRTRAQIATAALTAFVANPKYKITPMERDAILWETRQSGLDKLRAHEDPTDQEKKAIQALAQSSTRTGSSAASGLRGAQAHPQGS